MLYDHFSVRTFCWNFLKNWKYENYAKLTSCEFFLDMRTLGTKIIYYKYHEINGNKYIVLSK